MFGLGFIQKAVDKIVQRQLVKQSMGFITETKTGTDDERRKESDEAILYRTYEETSWVRACVDVITRAVISRGWILSPVQGMDPILANRERLLEFLANVNPQDTFDDLIEDCCRDLLVIHNAYWEIVRAVTDDPKSEPKQLWSMDPVTMNVSADDHGLVTGYIQEVNTEKTVNFTPDQVLHWKIGARGSNVYGNPRLNALVASIETDLYAANYQRAFFKRGAKVRGAIVMDGANAEQVQRNRAYLAEIAKKPEEAKGDIMLEGKMQYVPIGTQPKDMEFHQLRTFHRDEILAVFGCPPAKVSLIETGNIGAGSGDSQDQTLYEETVIPLQKKIAHRINKVLFREGFGIRDWELGFRPWVINKKEQAEVDKVYLETGVVNIDEVRVSIGLQPRVAPGDSTEPPALPPPDGGASPDPSVTPPGDVPGGDLDLSKQFTGKKDPSVNAAETKVVERNELNFEHAIVNFFNTLAGEIVTEVGRIAREDLKLKMAGLKFWHQFQYKTAENIPYYFPFYKFPVIIKGVRDFDPVSEIIGASDMEDMFNDQILTQAEEGGRLANERLKRSLPAQVAANIGKFGATQALRDSVRVYSDDLSSFLKRSLDDQVKVQLIEGLAAGEETRVLTGRVKDALQAPMPVKVRQAFKNDKGQWDHRLVERKIPLRTRAQLIARTETTRFMATGALDAYEQGGITMVDIVNPAADKECTPFIDQNPWTLEEAQGLLPIHHMCRCAFAPRVEAEPRAVPQQEQFSPLTGVEAEQLADQILPKAVNIEKVLTPKMKRLANLNSATLEGLEFRLKSRASLSRKIRNQSIDKRWTAAQMKVENLHDTSRYTMVMNSENYGSGARAVLDQLESEGYKAVKVKNYWDNKQYKGINSIMAHPSGQKFELQFHTPQSLRAKDPSHLLYEKARVLPTGDATKSSLKTEIEALWGQVKAPSGAKEIGKIIRKALMEKQDAQFKFFALVGDSGDTYGLIRVRGDDVERFDQFDTMDWQLRPDGDKWFNGDDNDADQVTGQEAKKLTDQWLKDRTGA